jgi:phosphopantetheinyl transferase
VPLLKLDSFSSQSFWALWKIEESREELSYQPGRDSEYLELMQIHQPQKKLEWLASRLIIQSLVEKMESPFHGIYKDAFGKPHLYQLPFQISIAHCFPWAAGAIHKSRSIGVDIEQPREKLLNIRERFLNSTEAEIAGTDLEILCKFWTGKEVLYKIYGRKKLIFKEHIQIGLDPENERQLNGQIVFNDFNKNYNIQTDYIHGHYLSIGT